MARWGASRDEHPVRLRNWSRSRTLHPCADSFPRKVMILQQLPYQNSLEPPPTAPCSPRLKWALTQVLKAYGVAGDAQAKLLELGSQLCGRLGSPSIGLGIMVLIQPPQSPKSLKRAVCFFEVS